MQALPSNGPATSNLVSFDEWLRSISLTRTTGYRYRRKGLVNTVNIFGRLYISREEIGRFEARAMSGEFAREVSAPSRQKAA
jgi:hypothetical protein